MAFAAAVAVAAFVGCPSCSAPGDGDGGEDGGGASLICSVDHWCWENPHPQGNELRGVWSSGPGDVWAVGMNGTIIHWDGTSWASAPSGTTNNLYGVWGAGAILHRRP